MARNETAKYRYKGNVSPENTSVAISYTGPDGKAQGLPDSAGETPLIQIGELIELSTSEYKRLAEYLVLEPVSANATADEQVPSPSSDNINEQENLAPAAPTAAKKLN